MAELRWLTSLTQAYKNLFSDTTNVSIPAVTAYECIFVYNNCFSHCLLTAHQGLFSEQPSLNILTTDTVTNMPTNINNISQSFTETLTEAVGNKQHNNEVTFFYKNPKNMTVIHLFNKTLSNVYII
jgi:hypothetical protein